MAESQLKIRIDALNGASAEVADLRQEMAKGGQEAADFASEMRDMDAALGKTGDEAESTATALREIAASSKQAASEAGKTNDALTKLARGDFGDGFEMAMRVLSAGLEQATASAERLGRTELPSALDDAQASAQRFGDSLMQFPIAKFIPLYQQFGDSSLKNADAITILTRGFQGATNGFNLLSAAAVKMQAEMGMITWEEAARQIDDLTGAADAQALALENAERSVQAYGDRWAGLAGEFAAAQEAFVKQQEEMQAAADRAELDRSISIYRITLEGAIGKEMTAFRDKQDELNAKAADLTARIAEMEQAKGRAFDATELENMRTELAGVNQALADNAAAHEQATSRILLSYAEQALAVDGLTKGELAALVDLQKSWGLLDESTATAIQSILGATDQLANDGSLAAFENSVRGVRDELLGIPTNVETVWTIRRQAIDAAYVPQEVVNQVGPIPQARGGSWVVNQPTMFVAGEAGVPERVTFEPMTSKQTPAAPAPTSGAEMKALLLDLPGQISRAVRDALILSQ